MDDAGIQRRLARIDREFREVAATLRPFELQRIDPTIDARDLDAIFGALDGKRGDSQLFMGFYSQAGIETALERYGILRALAERGFDDVRVALDLEDPYVHTLHVFDGAHDAPCDRLAELRVRRVATPDEHDFRAATGGADFLLLEWLMLQNPRRAFTPERPALPGQRHPGLGIGPEVLEMLQLMTERLGLAGIVAWPMLYHNAVLYSLRLAFIDPTVEGRLLALRRDLAARSLSEASWAIELGAVVDARGGAPFAWTGHEQVFALHRAVARHFETAGYQRARDRAIAEERYRIDEERFAAAKAASADYRRTHPKSD